MFSCSSGVMLPPAGYQSGTETHQSITLNSRELAVSARVGMPDNQH
jgi:hypothetical protein